MKDAINETIAIFHGKKVVYVDKELFENVVYNLLKEYVDISTLGDFYDSYKNAFHWLFANIIRTVGIQLYNDNEIRLNIVPSQIEDGKKCILLKEDDIENRDLDLALYLFLFELVYGKSQGKH